MTPALLDLSRRLRPLGGVLAVAFFAHSSVAQVGDSGLLIEEKYHHLGDTNIEDWNGVNAEPEGDSLKFAFQSVPASTPATLRIRHRDVDGIWKITVNGHKIGELRKRKDEADYYYEIPQGILVDGRNSFELTTEDKADDIAIGQIRLFQKSLSELLDLQQVKIRVADEATGDALPARISITTSAGQTPGIYHSKPAIVATRDGLVYVHGSAQVEIPKGNYIVSVTRGPEWSRAVEEMDLGADPVELSFLLKREVDTTGYVAADTHIHTVTFSGHGDASVEERMISLAGEGIEFAVATDHNHNTDFRPYQDRLELNEYFTPVVGNEVTTDNGHFNAFPLDPDGEVPMHDGTNWVKIVDDMRLKGAKVVILNHPRWPDRESGPFGKFGLNRSSGDRDSGTPFTFDAMELVNSTVDTEDPLYLFDDWFALLNRGEKIVAVGVSDSHTVGDPVGQGRTYIKSSSDEPTKLNVDELCENIVAGRSSVSLGIFSEVTIDEQFGPGDIVQVENSQIDLTLRVRSPGWIQPKKAVVFVNGEARSEQTVPAENGKPTDAKLTFQLPISGVDAYVVCVVLGDPVTAPGWKTLNGYTLAATNPVYLDVNGDGQYRNPRESARKVLTSLAGDRNALIRTLEIINPVLGIQLISLVDDDLSDEERETIYSLLEFRSSQSDVFKRYLEHVKSVEE